MSAPTAGEEPTGTKATEAGTEERGERTRFRGKHPYRRGVALGGCAAVALGACLWAGHGARRQGTHASASVPALSTPPAGSVGTAPAPPADIGRPAQPQPSPALLPVREAYNSGRYRDAEAQARQVLDGLGSPRSVAARTEAAQARKVLAYSAARRHDLPLARARFAVLREEAARLPGGGRQEGGPGDAPPTLTEDAAYQHAVCTAALGDKSGAEAEYLAFLAHFPESPLMSGAVGRIARMHGGDLPLATQEAWRRAERIALERQHEQAVAASVCGPECLAELLRRRGERADVHALAREMGTGERGTTLAALADAARAHGFRPAGLTLTSKGLAEQRLPVVALVRPAHYVLVEAVTAPGATPGGVTVWDPDAGGVGHGKRSVLAAADWGRWWDGVALALEPGGPVKTARR